MNNTQFLIKSSSAPVSYADTVNKQFYKSKSQYVSLQQRLADTIDHSLYRKTIVAESVKEFLVRNPNITKWEDFVFCRCEQTTLDKIVIDITLQRMLDIIHSCGIMDRFQQFRVMPISVYEDPLAPGKYVCWDGQHTAIMLLLIAAHSLQLDIYKCEVPIVVYASTQKAEMRENFMELNGFGEAKLDLSLIDIYHQMVFGVRTDNSVNPEWNLVEQKQQALEQAGMFVTNSKFGDTDQPGALSRLQEVMDTKNYDLTITQNFCKYFSAVCGSNRPVQPKEIEMLYQYFKLCQREGITVSDAYIKALAKSLQFDNGDFNAIMLSDKAKDSYKKWWIANNISIDGSLRGISYKSFGVPMTFFVKQVAKNFKGSVPRGEPMWLVPDQDLI